MNPQKLMNHKTLLIHQTPKTLWLSTIIFYQYFYYLPKHINEIQQRKRTCHTYQILKSSEISCIATSSDAPNKFCELHKQMKPMQNKLF